MPGTHSFTVVGHCLIFLENVPNVTTRLLHAICISAAVPLCTSACVYIEATHSMFVSGGAGLEPRVSELFVRLATAALYMYIMLLRQQRPKVAPCQQMCAIVLYSMLADTLYHGYMYGL